MVAAGENLHRRELRTRLRSRSAFADAWQTGVRELSHIDAATWLSAALVACGFLLRARGELFGSTPSLWGDEAAWAIRLLRWPLLKHALRPLGFIAVSRGLAHWLSPSERVLRFLPWLGGVTSLGLALPLGQRLFRSSGARLLFLALVALNPWAIDLAKEFKPYSLGLALHMGLWLLSLRYWSEGRRRDLAVALGLVLTGTLWSQDIVFAYPALFALLALRAWREQRARQLAGIAVTGAATLALLAAQYHYFWRSNLRGNRASVEAAEYWGKKYDVFFTAAHTCPRLRWTFSKVGEMLAMPGARRESFHSKHLSVSTIRALQQIDYRVWCALGILGLLAIAYRRDHLKALCLVLPLVTLLVCNHVGIWPLGAFRTNLFVLFYAAGLATTAIDAALSRSQALELLPASCLVLLPFVSLGWSHHSLKTSSVTSSSSFILAMSRLAAIEPSAGKSPAPVVLALDNMSCPIWHYYTEYHPKHRRYARLTRPFRARCTRDLPQLAEVLRHGLKHPPGVAYVLASRSQDMDAAATELPSDLRIERREIIGGGDELVMRVSSAVTPETDAQEPGL